jgi:O-antigen/teichoic acid export membrane protein
VSVANAAERPVRSKLFLHFVTLATGELSTRLLIALAWIVLARRLGAATLGVVEFSLGILAYFQLAAHAGLDWTGMRRIAQGGDVAATARDLLGLRLALATGSFIALVLVAARLPQSGVGGLLVSYGLLLFSGAANLRWAFLAEERGRAVVLLGTIAQLAFLAAILGLVDGPEHVRRLPWIQLSSEMVAVLGLAFLFVRSGHPLAPHWAPARWRAVLREALPIGATQLVGQILYNLDVVLLGLLGHLGRVGIYSAAYRVVLLLQVVPAAYFTAIFPALAREYDSPVRRGASDLTGRTLHFVIAAVAPVSLVVFDRADWIVTTVYGATFQAAGVVLRLLVWSFPIVAVRALFRHLLVASHQERAHFVLSLGAAALNVALNLALIPRFHIVGAAVATLAAEAALLLLVAGRAARILGARALTHPAVGPLMASAAMAIALAAGAASTPALRICTALVVYLLALVLSWRVWGWPR